MNLGDKEWWGLHFKQRGVGAQTALLKGKEGSEKIHF